MKKVLKSKCAFTLAEVLITLGIIGVVAALTLPSVITNYQKKQTVEQLKKAYSTFSQALVSSQQENGSSSEWDTTLLNSSYEDNLSYFEKYWKPYLKIIKVCKTMSECGYKINGFHYIDGSGIVYGQYDNVPGFIYGDGAYAYIRPYSTSLNLLPELQMLCIDLNGAKGPNAIGKDVFFLRIDIKKGVFRTMDGVSSCTKQHFAGGRSCAGKIIQDGWQIKDDYPW